jgi:hypothetical protein
MADQELTLLEAAKLEKPSYAAGLIGTYAEAYPNFAVAPIVPSDRIYSWDVEDDLPYTGSTGSRLVGADFDSSQGNVKPYASEVKAYGGKIQVDEYIEDNLPRSVAAQEIMQLKAFARKAFIDTFEGAGGADFRGIRDWLLYDSAFSGQTIDASGSSQAIITLDMLDELLSKMVITPFTQIYANPVVLRLINKLNRGNVSEGYNVVRNDAQVGVPLRTYNGIPLIPTSDGKNTNLLSTVEPDYATTATSCSLYCVTWGMEGAIYHSSNTTRGANGAPVPQIVRAQPGTNYNYTRFKYYLGFAPTTVRCVGRIRYLKNAMS